MGWRDHSGGDVDRDENWGVLRSLFALHGYTLWTQRDTYFYFKPGIREGDTDLAQNGFLYSTPLRSYTEAGGIRRLYNFYPTVSTLSIERYWGRFH